MFNSLGSQIIIIGYVTAFFLSFQRLPCRDDVGQPSHVIPPRGVTSLGSRTPFFVKKQMKENYVSDQTCDDHRVSGKEGKEATGNA